VAYPIKTNIVPLIKSLADAIQPFAEGNFVRLHFESFQAQIELSYHPESIIPDLTHLICRIITLTPQEYEVKVEIFPVDIAKDKFIRIGVLNSGVDLSPIKKNIITGVNRNISVTSLENSGTRFEFEIPLDVTEKTAEEIQLSAPANSKPYAISPFYKKLKKHLTTHFTSIDNFEKVADARSRRDGVFMKKINAVILAHLDKEGFDTASLAKALALSRTQLFRRLKPLIGFAPGRYIKYVRLQKAKEFLEKEDLTVSEVAFRTGFVNLSHFTRAFREQFGFNPSELRHNRPGNNQPGF
jgi:AraC-like DNA-binding protein